MDSLEVLPIDASDLSISYTYENYIDVFTDDGIRVENCADSGYTLHQFGKWHSNNTDFVDFTCNVQSGRAPSASTVYLQIWNYNSSEWETVDSESVAGADIDFDLTCYKTNSISNYYDAYFDPLGYRMTFRIYQEAV